jgi:hypothetical protein
MADSGALWVSISSWRIRAAATADQTAGDPFERFLGEAVPVINSALLDKGVVSSWVVRTGERALTYVGVYTSRVAMEEVWAWAREDGEFRPLFDHWLELVSRDSGPLTDVFHLGNRWQYPIRPSREK